MTHATEKRELRLLIESILSDLGIEHPTLAMELSTAVYQYRLEVRDGLTPARAKERVQAALLRGLSKQLPKQEMADRIERALARIGYNFSGAPATDQERLIAFAMRDEQSGRTIERFVEWACNDTYWFDKISSVTKIMELWLKQSTHDNKAIKADGGGYYV